MAYLIDTNIAIHLRDGDGLTVHRIDQLPGRPLLSIVSLIELEGGVYAKPHLMPKRRAALDAMLQTLEVIDFETPMIESYRRIVETSGYSRPRILDRMIAATALVSGLTLITMNGDDFRGIPELKLEIW